MIIRKEIFEKLGGFDEKFFISFEDVDIGWRAWILGYKVMMVPRSIVYHMGGQTIKNLKKEIEFHGLKNQISMKITNFESNLVIKNLIKFFVIYGFRELRIKLDYLFRGKTSLTATKHEEKIAQNINFSTILRSIIWIFKNSKYLRKKHRIVNSSRNMKTEDLIKLGVITG